MAGAALSRQMREVRSMGTPGSTFPTFSLKRLQMCKEARQRTPRQTISKRMEAYSYEERGNERLVIISFNPKKVLKSMPDIYKLHL